jgi:methyl-accepting chemotaxis protein
MNLLSRVKIRTKLASMVALAALTVCGIIALSASLSESRMLEDRVVQMRSICWSAWPRRCRKKSRQEK